MLPWRSNQPGKCTKNWPWELQAAKRSRLIHIRNAKQDPPNENHCAKEATDEKAAVSLPTRWAHWHRLECQRTGKCHSAPGSGAHAALAPRGDAVKCKTKCLMQVPQNKRYNYRLVDPIPLHCCSKNKKKNMQPNKLTCNLYQKSKRLPATRPWEPCVNDIHWSSWPSSNWTPFWIDMSVIDCRDKLYMKLRDIDQSANLQIQLTSLKQVVVFQTVVCWNPIYFEWSFSNRGGQHREGGATSSTRTSSLTNTGNKELSTSWPQTYFQC